VFDVNYEPERLPNPVAKAILTWGALAVAVAGLGVTGWRIYRARRGINTWTHCEPQTPSGDWLDPRTGQMRPQAVEAVANVMDDLLSENAELDTDGLVRQTVWELAECDEESLTSAARGQLRRVAEAVLHGGALPGEGAYA
jgi:hypothetical protein